MRMLITTTLAALSSIGLAGGVAEGRSTLWLKTSRGDIETHIYRPHGVDPTRIIVVMHGTLRNALTYREDSVAMADRFGALLIVPKFDSDRFPSRLYQRGGILNADGSAVPPQETTYPVVREVIDSVRSRMGKKLPFWLIGHSAGGQFLVRMAAFGPIGAERIVAANAGSHVFPTRELPFGYGFGNLPEALSSDARLRAYLAAPLTLFQGTGDNAPDEYFDQSVDAMKQGPGRYQRALGSFAAAQKLANEKGWPFNWRLVEAPGVGHDHELMFNHPACRLALFGPRRKSFSDIP